MATALLASGLFVGLALAQRTRGGNNNNDNNNSLQTTYGQCGGQDYTGPTACPTAYYCTYGNPWYSQCVPLSQIGNPDDPISDPENPVVETSFQTVITITQTLRPVEVVTTYITFLSPVATPTPPPVAPSPDVIVVDGKTITLVPDAPVTRRAVWVQDEPPQKREEVLEPAQAIALDSQLKPKKRSPAREVEKRGPETPKTLQQGLYWIRAVAAPNFHKYIQTKPQNEPGTAILGPNTSAGQYNISSGQLVAAWLETPLYMHVEKPADFTQRTLATWFNTTKNEFGTFAWSGDALTWSVPEVKRQNLAAWLVCKDSAMFINTGAYAYQTPSGCSDQTIHYYNGATPDA